MKNMQLMSDYSQEISAPNEHRGREFKCSESWDALKWKIAKSAMAMANKRDGGIIVIGVQKNAETHEAVGMADSHFDTFKDDEISAFVNKYADPFVSISVSRPHLGNKKFVVISVREFEHLPVVCAKNGPEELKEGAVYIRGYNMVATCQVQSQTEMRELLDIAVERGIRSFLGRAAGAGLETRLSPTDDEHFNAEQREFVDRLSESKDMSRGYFLFSIRPTAYQEDRIEPIDVLHQVVKQATVNHHGWSFPLTYRDEQMTEQQCVGSPAHAKDASEFWRMYQSGHFLCAMAYRDPPSTELREILDPRALRIMPHNFVPQGYVSLHHIHLFVTMTYVLASRFGAALNYGTQIRISVVLTKTRDRVAISTDFRAPLRGFWRASALNIESVHTLDLAALLADPVAQAAQSIGDIVQRFAGDEFSVRDIRPVQDYIWNGR